jgi:hypothetical protein
MEEMEVPEEMVVLVAKGVLEETVGSSLLAQRMLQMVGYLYLVKMKDKGDEEVIRVLPVFQGLLATMSLLRVYFL